MIGAKSIVLNLKVTNNKNVTYNVKVQANKNYGLCDLILPNNPIKPKKTYIGLFKEEYKKEKALYNVRKIEYDKKIAERKSIRNAVFNKFQGRQLNDGVVLNNLKNMLNNLLSDVEL